MPFLLAIEKGRGLIGGSTYDLRAKTKTWKLQLKYETEPILNHIYFLSNYFTLSLLSYFSCVYIYMHIYVCMYMQQE